MANEKRLIDANALKDVLVRYLNAPHVNLCNLISQGMGVAIKTCIELLDSKKAVDAVEVVHGEWIPCDDDFDVWYECSVCGGTSPGEAYYCPSCGAKMDA